MFCKVCLVQWIQKQPSSSRKVLSQTGNPLYSNNNIIKMAILKYKIVFLGDQSVGKTSIITRFIYDSFQGSKTPTVGIDFLTKTIQQDNQTIRMQLWDTAGQQRFRCLIPGYIRDADCCMLVFDVTAKGTIDGLQKWIDFIRDTRGKEARIFMIANKTDMEYSQSDIGVAKELANKNGIEFVEVSAKSGKNILNLFMDVAKILQKPQQSVLQREPTIELIQAPKGQKSNSSCPC